MLNHPKTTGRLFPLRYYGFPFNCQTRAEPVHDVGEVRWS